MIQRIIIALAIFCMVEAASGYNPNPNLPEANNAASIGTINTTATVENGKWVISGAAASIDIDEGAHELTVPPSAVVAEPTAYAGVYTYHFNLNVYFQKHIGYLRAKYGNGQYVKTDYGMPINLYYGYIFTYWYYATGDTFRIPVKPGLGTFEVELFDPDGVFQGSFTVIPPNIGSEKKCDECVSGCSSVPSLRSVHFRIPVGRAPYYPGTPPAPVGIEFYQEDISIIGARSIRLADPLGSTVVPTYVNSDELQSLRVGDYLTTIEEIPPDTPGNSPGLDVTVSSDWQHPSTTVIRKVTIRNKVNTNNESYLEFDELVGGHHSITRYRKIGGDWIMETGDGLRREIRSVLETATTRSIRVKIQERSDEPTGSGPAIYETISDRITTSNKLDIGWREVETIDDPDGAHLATTTSYYATGEDSSLDGSGSAEGYSRVKQVDYPTGEREKHYYFQNAPEDSFQRTHAIRKSYNGTPDALETKIESMNSTSPVTGLPVAVTRETDRVDNRIIRKVETLDENGITETRSYSDTGTYTSAFVFLDSGGASVLMDSDGTGSSTQVNVSGEFTTTTMVSGYVVGVPSDGTATLQVVETSEDVTDGNGEVVLSSRYRSKDGVQVLMSRKIATAFDGLNRAIRYEHYVDGKDDPIYVTERDFSCCGISREKNADGIEIYYAYDSLKRLVGENRNGVTIEYRHRGRTKSTHRYAQSISLGQHLIMGGASAGNEVLRVVSNICGDPIEKWNRSPYDGSLVKTSIETLYNLGGGIGRQVTLRPPSVSDDGTSIPETVHRYQLDGKISSIRGNLENETGCRYSATEFGGTEEHYSFDGSIERGNTITQYDWSQRKTKVIYSSDLDQIGGNDYELTAYNGKGQISKVVDPDGEVTLYDYNVLGERTLTAVDLNSNGNIDLSTDRVSSTVTDLAQRGNGEWVVRTSSAVWQDEASSESTTVSVEEISLDGFQQWTTEFPSLRRGGTHSMTTADGTGVATQTTTFTDGTIKRVIFNAGVVSKEIMLDKDANVLYQIDTEYDPLMRPISKSDSRSGTIDDHYVNEATDVIDRRQDETGGETKFSYDHRGRLYQVDSPNTADEGGGTMANITSAGYYPSGRIRERNIDGAFQVAWSYDYAGRPETMTTYGNSISVTRWGYEASRGLLVSKHYNSPTPGAGVGIGYSYTPGGRLRITTQARKVSGSALTTTYIYGSASGSSASGLDEVFHSDGTPGYSIVSRDRLGRPKVLEDAAAGTTNYTYARHGEIQTEEVVSGLLAGQKLDYRYDSLLRPLGYSAWFAGAELGSTVIAYDTSGNVGRVSGNGHSANYQYHHERGSLRSLSFSKGSDPSPWLEKIRIYDAVNRLTSETAYLYGAGAPQAVDHHRFAYDEIDRTILHHSMDGTSWKYVYGPGGQVRKATKMAEDNVNELYGGKYVYYFDGIGNRTLVQQSRGPSQAARTSSYTSDSFGHYTGISHPAFVEVIGVGSAAAPIMVNGQEAARQGEHFRHEIPRDNSAGPAWLDVTISDGNHAEEGSLALPAAVTNNTYDEDGNLTSDGLWRYSWDGANRLICCEREEGLLSSGAPYLRVEYVYDARGRRIRSSVFDSATASSPSRRTLFAFSGWRCLAELDGAGHPIRKYTWGLDLAGSTEDSVTGNAGALLWLVDCATEATHIYLYDHNGNVSGLVDAGNRRVSARYDYDAFGQSTATYGPYAKSNPFTFATKYQEFHQGLIWYGRRYYNPSQGRWLSHDPAGEKGGLNTYAFLGNDAVNQVDVLGLSPGGMVGRQWAKRYGFSDKQARELTYYPKSWGYMGPAILLGGGVGYSVYTAALASPAVAIGVVGALDETGVIAGSLAGATAAGRQLSKPERLGLIESILQKLKSKDADEALGRLVRVMEAVEDACSGVVKNPNPGLKPDGRMYPPQADNIIRNADGTIDFITRGHAGHIDKNGVITWQKR